MTVAVLSRFFLRAVGLDFLTIYTYSSLAGARADRLAGVLGFLTMAWLASWR